MKATYKNIYNIIFLLNTLLLSLGCSSQSITFKSYGEMDKPLPIIEINERQPDDDIEREVTPIKKGKDWVYVAYVDHDSFLAIKEMVKKSNTNVEYELSYPYPYPYGTYRISYSDTHNDFDYMLISNKESYHFFKTIAPLTKTNNLLYEEIVVLIDRLK